MIIVSISNWKITSQLQLENLVCLVSALAGYPNDTIEFWLFHVGVSKQGYPKKHFKKKNSAFLKILWNMKIFDFSWFPYDFIGVPSRHLRISKATAQQSVLRTCGGFAWARGSRPGTRWDPHFKGKLFWSRNLGYFGSTLRHHKDPTPTTCSLQTRCLPMTDLAYPLTCS